MIRWLLKEDPTERPTCVIFRSLSCVCACVPKYVWCVPSCGCWRFACGLCCERLFSIMYQSVCLLDCLLRCGELLKSDMLPSKVEYEIMKEAIRTIITPDTTIFGELMDRLFQNSSDEHMDFTYDANTARPVLGLVEAGHQVRHTLTHNTRTSHSHSLTRAPTTR